MVLSDENFKPRLLKVNVKKVINIISLKCHPYRLKFLLIISKAEVNLAVSVGRKSEWSWLGREWGTGVHKTAEICVRVTNYHIAVFNDTNDRMQLIDRRNDTWIKLDKWYFVASRIENPDSRCMFIVQLNCPIHFVLSFEKEQCQSRAPQSLLR